MLIINMIKIKSHNNWPQKSVKWMIILIFISLNLIGLSIEAIASDITTQEKNNKESSTSEVSPLNLIFPNKNDILRYLFLSKFACYGNFSNVYYSSLLSTSIVGHTLIGIFENNWLQPEISAPILSSNGGKNKRRAYYYPRMLKSSYMKGFELKYRYFDYTAQLAGLDIDQIDIPIINDSIPPIGENYDIDYYYSIRFKNSDFNVIKNTIKLNALSNINFDKFDNFEYFSSDNGIYIYKNKDDKRVYLTCRQAPSVSD